MTLQDWWALGLICAAGAMSPGMSLAMVLKHSLSSGSLAGVVASWSHALGIGLYAWITAFGLSALITGKPLLFAGILLLGAGFLLKLGVTGLLNAYRSRSQTKTATPATSDKHLGNALDDDNTLKKTTNDAPNAPLAYPKSYMLAMSDGFKIAILNPKTMLFFAAVFSGFIANQSNAERFGMGMVALVIDGLWYTSVACSFGLGWIRQYYQRIEVFLQVIFSLIFTGYGLYLLNTTLRVLLTNSSL